MKITADKGCYLTETEEMAYSQRTFREMVILSDSSELSKWKQVTESERKLMKEEENIFYNKTFDKEYIEKVGLLVSGIKTSINSIELTDEEAVKYNYLLPSFDELVGKTVFPNNKFVCNGSVYSVNTSHTVDSSMKPTAGESTPMLLSAKNSSESESNYYRLISKI